MDALSRALELIGISLPNPVPVLGGVLIIALIVALVIRQKRAARRLSKPAPVIDKLPPNMEMANAETGVSDERQEPALGTPVSDIPLPSDHAFSRLSGLDDSLSTELTAARQLLDDGNVSTAIEALSRRGEMEQGAGRDLRRQADARLSGAATIHLVSGDLKLANDDVVGAMAEYGEAIEAVPRGRDTLMAECLNKHGAAAYAAQDLDTAAASFKRAARIIERIRGLNHPDVATAISNLAMLHYVRGDLAAAEPLYSRALEIDESSFGKNATEVATDLNNMALLYQKQGRLDDAEVLFARALSIKESQFDAGHPSLVTGLRNYAALLRDMDRGVEAEAYERRAEA